MTLVELMVAMALEATIIAGVLIIMQSSTRIDQSSTSIANIDNIGAITLSTLQTSIEHAGFLGHAHSEFREINNQVVGFNSLPYDQPLRGWVVEGSQWKTSTGNSSVSEPPLSGIGHVIVDGSSIVRMIHGSQIELAINGFNNGSIEVNSAGNRLLNLNDIAIISDGENSDIFQVTNSPDYTNSAAVILQHTDPLVKNYHFEKSKALKFLDYTYFVAQTNRNDPRGNPITALFRRDYFGNVEELIEGVETLKVLYGQKTGVNNNLAFYEANNPSLKWQDIKSVSLSIVVSSVAISTDSNQNTSYKNIGGMLVTADASGTNTLQYPADGRSRKVFNTTFTLKNLMSDL